MSQAIIGESTEMEGILWQYSDHWTSNVGRTTGSDEVGNEHKRRIQARGGYKQDKAYTVKRLQHVSGMAVDPEYHNARRQETHPSRAAITDSD